MAIDIKKLLQSVVSHGASDLHLVARAEPQIRIDGTLKAVNLPVLTGDDIEEMAYALLTEKQKKSFEEHWELDFALMLPGIGRFRANYYKTLGDIAAAFRIIPTEIPSLDDLNAPALYKELIKIEPWGDFSIGTIKKLQKENIFIRFFITTKKKFDSELDSQNNPMKTFQIEGNLSLKENEYWNTISSALGEKHINKLWRIYCIHCSTS